MIYRLLSATDEIMIKTNIPKEFYLEVDGTKYFIGNNIRIVMNNYNEYIGKIKDIRRDRFILTVPIFKGDASTKEVYFSNVKKLRMAAENETFDTVPYYDEETKEFWRTHWITKDGIREKSEKH